MRNYRYNRLLLFSVAALTVFSCGEDVSNNSTVNSFEKYTVKMLGSAVTVSELVADSYTFDFVLDEKQMFDVTLTVGVGGATTATEGEDFELVTHEIELAAYQGQDGFSVTVEVFEDFVVEEGDEDIYLVFTSTLPSGVQLSETKVITIEDSGLIPVPARTADFTLRWEFVDPSLAEEDPCSLVHDLDITFQTAGDAAMYDSDLLGFQMATLSCPEEGTLDITDMTDGEVYEVWIAIYAGIDLDALVDPSITVYVDFARENTEFNGTVKIAGAFNASMGNDGGVMFTIERHGEVVTIKDLDGGVRGEGRIGKPQLGDVKKPG